MPVKDKTQCKTIGKLLFACLDNNKGKPNNCKLMMDLFMDCLSKNITKMN